MALVDERVTGPRIDALWMIGEIAGDVSEGIAGDEGAAELGWDEWRMLCRKLLRATNSDIHID